MKASRVIEGSMLPMRACSLSTMLFLVGCAQTTAVAVDNRDPAALHKTACQRPIIGRRPEPSGRRIAQGFLQAPVRAGQEERSGCALLEYKIGKDGRPAAIKVDNEYPAGYGYGEAAIAAMKDTRFRPRAFETGPHYHLFVGTF